MDKKKQIIIAISLVALGVAAAYIAFATKPQAQTDKPKRIIAKAEIQVVESSRHQIQITADGKIVPAQKTVVTSEVAGTIAYKNPNLEPGARLKKGNTMVRIDPSAYQLQVEGQKANLMRAQLNLQLEEAQQTIAENDAKRLSEAFEGGDLELALRKPHLQRAQAELKAAESALKEAELKLSKTTVRAPYDAIVADVQAEVGSLLAPQMPVATLIGTQELWARISIPVGKLSQIQLPNNQGEGGSQARIQQQFGQDGSISKQGHVTRVLGELDPLGHMAQLIVTIRDPFNISNTAIMPGANVTVTIDGKSEQDIFSLPRQAIFNQRFVWQVGPGNTISMKEVSIAWKDKNKVYINRGLKEKDRIVTSTLRAPVNGMQIAPIKAL